MPIQTRVVSAPFHLVGDGISTEVRLSSLAFPFNNAPGGGSLAAVELISGSGGAGFFTSATVEGSEVVLTLAEALVGNSGEIRFLLYYNLPG